MGFSDVLCTPRGSDGGIDVRGAAALAQVKAQLTPVGRPELQALFGVAASEGKQPLFFSLMSYTAQARAWADGVGMALFRFDHGGEVEAVNEAASALLRHATAGGTATPSVLAWPSRVSDRAGRAAIDAERRGIVARERIRLLGQTWVWVQLVRLGYTTEGRRRTVRPTIQPVQHHAVTLGFDLVAGAPFPVPPVDPRPAPDGAAALAAVVETATILRQFTDAWAKVEAVTQPAAVARHWARLERLGVPGEALSVSPAAAERVLAPLFVGLLEHRGGGRIAVVDGFTRRLLPDLSVHLTAALPWAVEQLEAVVRPVDAR